MARARVSRRRRLVGTDEINTAVKDLEEMFPTAPQYQPILWAKTERWNGRPPPAREVFVWPPEGPGFRPERHRWHSESRSRGSGALNRLTVQPSLAERVAVAGGVSPLDLVR